MKICRYNELNAHTLSKLSARVLCSRFFTCAKLFYFIFFLLMVYNLVMDYVEIVIQGFYDLMGSSVPVILGLIVLSVVFRYIARVFR